ncbi:hypothetical protein IFM89_023575 [Coptis chinensis]|uniref:Uncharacterized protein n=1 Tax=Coptis chinensis TaxID=261450 RepID=A0A835HJG8_9MAGN|nr:hypothetical protein IFM89_023575 [Coptis chinensis]
MVTNPFEKPKVKVMLKAFVSRTVSQLAKHTTQCMVCGHGLFLYTYMENETNIVGPPRSHVKATFCLNSEVYSVNASSGTISEQLVSVKEESVCILKDFITKHNVPNDVPDELVEASEDDEVPEKPPKKQK